MTNRAKRIYLPPPLNSRGEYLQAYGETERLITERERACVTSISRTTWWRLEQDGVVPPSKKIGGRTVWLLSDILVWMHCGLSRTDKGERMSQRDNSSPEEQRYP